MWPDESRLQSSVGADFVRELWALKDDMTCEQYWPLIAGRARTYRKCDYRSLIAGRARSHRRSGKASRLKPLPQEAR